MVPSNFETAVDAAYSRLNISLTKSPSNLLEAWASFVDLCAGGYPLGWDEFKYDLLTRTDIERLLEDSQLQAFQELHEYASRVHTVDEHYRRIVVRIPSRTDQPWWLANIPLIAGPELVADAKDMFDMKLNVSPSFT
jgi:hypothetical protein